MARGGRLGSWMEHVSQLTRKARPHYISRAPLEGASTSGIIASTPLAIGPSKEPKERKKKRVEGSPFEEDQVKKKKKRQVVKGIMLNFSFSPCQYKDFLYFVNLGANFGFYLVVIVRDEEEEYDA
ncbi:hypothetical protein ACLOJK_032754 [Asimina triloba]